LVEIVRKGKRVERVREIVYWLVEDWSKNKFCDRGREVVYWMIKINSESE
jgi:hypothetical protein